MTAKLRVQTRYARRIAAAAIAERLGPAGAGVVAILDADRDPDDPGAVLLRINFGVNAVAAETALRADGYAVDHVGPSATGDGVVIRVRPGATAPATAKELAERTGLTPRQVEHWCVLGHLQAVTGGGVQGSQRTFAGTEVDVAMTMARLIRVGLTLAAAAQVARGDGDLGDGILVLVLQPGDDGDDDGPV